MTRLHPYVDPSAERVLVLHGKRLLGFIVYVGFGPLISLLWSIGDGSARLLAFAVSLPIAALLAISFRLLFGWPITEGRRYRIAPDPRPYPPFAPSREAHHRILQSVLTAIWMREFFLAVQYREVVRRLGGD